MKHLLKITGSALFLMLFQAASAQSIEQVLKHYYPEYNKKHQCFIGKSLKYYYDHDKPVYGDYCLKIDAQKTVHTVQGKMQYILLAGHAIDLEEGSFQGAHVVSGAVGMLVLKALGDQDWQVVAAKAGIAVGAYGSAPRAWTLHRFGTDTWGFLNTAGDMHCGAIQVAVM